MGPLEFVLKRSVVERYFGVLCVHNVTGRLGPGKIADIQAATLFHAFVFWMGHLHFEHHDTVTTGTHWIELSRSNGFAGVGQLKCLAEVVPGVQDLRLAPFDIHETIRILAHSVLVVLFLRIRGHEITHGVDHVLKVFHGNLPAILLLVKQLVGQPGEDTLNKKSIEI